MHPHIYLYIHTRACTHRHICKYVYLHTNVHMHVRIHTNLWIPRSYKVHINSINVDLYLLWLFILVLMHILILVSIHYVYPTTRTHTHTETNTDISWCFTLAAGGRVKSKSLCPHRRPSRCKLDRASGSPWPSLVQVPTKPTLAVWTRCNRNQSKRSKKVRACSLQWLRPEIKREAKHWTLCSSSISMITYHIIQNDNDKRTVMAPTAI